MSLLEAKDIHFAFGDKTIFAAADIRLFEGEHAALVGPNGSGKTTLLKLLNRELKPDSGLIRKNGKKRVGYLDQYAEIDPARSVEDYLEEAYADLFAKERRMEALYEEAAQTEPTKQERLFVRAAAIGDELVEKNFYGVKSEIGRILGGLGLASDILEMRIRQLSAGMRARIILAKLLLEEADLLLLDEPTNFLDAEHIEWLKKFLADYPKAFLVVSHHEDLLRSVAQTVHAVENTRLVRYKGDFSYYLAERALRRSQREKAYESQQKFIKRTEEFIEKNIAREKTAKRAKSRRRMLQKLERVQRPSKERAYRFHFPSGRRAGEKVLVVEDLVIGYEEPLVEPLNWTVKRGEKVVITGENGIGKTTFVRTVLEELPSLAGSFTWIDSAHIGYCAQEKALPGNHTPFTFIREHYPAFTRKEVMDLLAAHGIDREMARRKIATLSGGELTKLRLSLLRHEKANVLILDEPTNHLDFKAKEALFEALADYQGTLILVSHEKAFYEKVCDYEITLTTE